MVSMDQMLCCTISLPLVRTAARLLGVIGNMKWHRENDSKFESLVAAFCSPNLTTLEPLQWRCYKGRSIFIRCEDDKKYLNNQKTYSACLDTDGLLSISVRDRIHHDWTALLSFAESNDLSSAVGFATAKPSRHKSCFIILYFTINGFTGEGDSLC